MAPNITRSWLSSKNFSVVMLIFLLFLDKILGGGESLESNPLSPVEESPDLVILNFFFLGYTKNKIWDISLPQNATLLFNSFQ